MNELELIHLLEGSVHYGVADEILELLPYEPGFDLGATLAEAESDCSRLSEVARDARASQP